MCKPILRECPECDRIISPVTQPRVGDIAQCPRCHTWLTFGESLMLRRATLPEQQIAQLQAAKAAS